jgi:hypothetical protein
MRKNASVMQPASWMPVRTYSKLVLLKSCIYWPHTIRLVMMESCARAGAGSCGRGYDGEVELQSHRVTSMVQSGLRAIRRVSVDVERY